MYILKDNNYSKIEVVLLCLSLTILSSFVLNLGSLFVILSPHTKINNLYIIILGITMVVGFIFIPTVILKRLIGFITSPIRLINIYKFLMYIILIFVVSLFYSVKMEEIIHPFVVATCEEYLFRGLFFSLLLTKFSKFKSIIIGSLIFSLLLHLNGNFIENLLIKFPTSVILYIIREKIGLQESIVVHWLYNLIITKISM
ncbi:CPBP family glutamic-type intramembrane protease [Staphylococcus pseudintermedius]|uniref:CPBP family glutamic-type intramembrane protease n=1 Tax=Staphylococcus pseudintermedius TaxID=283734 RepID=UPI003F73943D